MAISEGLGYVPFPDEIVVNKDGTLNIYSVRALQETLFTLVANYNGQISMGDGTSYSKAGNLNAVYIDVITPGANVEFAVKHELARVPIGFDIVSKDKPGIIYTSRKDSWTASVMFLKCSVAATTIRLRVY